MADGFPSRRPLLFQALEALSTSPCHPPPMRVPSRQCFFGSHMRRNAMPDTWKQRLAPSPRCHGSWHPGCHPCVHHVLYRFSDQCPEPHHQWPASTLEDHFESIETRFQAVERSISDLKESMDGRFQSLERLIIGLDRSVEARITGLESTLDAGPGAGRHRQRHAQRPPTPHRRS